MGSPINFNKFAQFNNQSARNNQSDKNEVFPNLLNKISGPFKKLTQPFKDMSDEEQGFLAIAAIVSVVAIAIFACAVVFSGGAALGVLAGFQMISVLTPFIFGSILLFKYHRSKRLANTFQPPKQSKGETSSEYEERVKKAKEAWEIKLEDQQREELRIVRARRAQVAARNALLRGS